MGISVYKGHSSTSAGSSKNNNVLAWTSTFHWRSKSADSQQEVKLQDNDDSSGHMWFHPNVAFGHFWKELQRNCDYRRNNGWVSVSTGVRWQSGQNKQEQHAGTPDSRLWLLRTQSSASTRVQHIPPRRHWHLNTLSSSFPNVISAIKWHLIGVCLTWKRKQESTMRNIQRHKQGQQWKELWG